MKLQLTTLLASVTMMATSAFAVMPKVDPSIKTYEQTSGISGNLNSVGSDTLNNLMTMWAEKFKSLYPNINIQIEGKGSATAPPALVAGTAQLGPMSRPMKNTEIEAFENKYGYKPTAVPVCLDTLAVFVNKENPIKGLSMNQLDGIFSSTRKSGNENVNYWGQLGLTGEWSKKTISLYGRNSASGTYGFFKDEALRKGDYKPTVKEQAGSSSVVQGVGTDISAIGYSGIGYKTSDVRALPLSTELSGKFIEPTYENALNGEYPLTRFLYIYFNKKPGTNTDPLTMEFLKFILSKEGQEIVLKDGYFPLPSEAVNDALSRLDK